MRNKDKKYFDKLWKVDVLMNILKIECMYEKTTVTMKSTSKIERELNLMEWAFEQGMDYVKNTKEVTE